MRVSLQLQAFQQLIIPSIQKLVENMKVSFPVVLVYNTGFLQKVVKDVRSHGCTLQSKTEEWKEIAKAT